MSEVVEVLYRSTAIEFSVGPSTCAPVWNGGSYCGRKDELGVKSMIFSGRAMGQEQRASSTGAPLAQPASEVGSPQSWA